MDKLSGHWLPRRAGWIGLRDVLPLDAVDLNRGVVLLGHPGQPQAVHDDVAHRGGWDARGVCVAGPRALLRVLRDHLDPDVPDGWYLGRREPATGGDKVLYLHFSRVDDHAGRLSGPGCSGEDFLDRRLAVGRRSWPDSADRDSRTDPVRTVGEGAGGAAAQLAAGRVRLQAPSRPTSCSPAYFRSSGLTAS